MTGLADWLPRGEAGDLLRVYDDAARPILGDLSVWADEARRDGAAPLPWPLRVDGKGYQQLFRILAVSMIENALDALREAHGPAAVPNDPSSHFFQVILRVARRATDAGEQALLQRFGGSGRMSVKRDLLNWAKKRDADAAIRSGLPRDEAFRQAGLSRAGAYRALHRKR